ncbi:hypothetical protein [Pseudofrankia inefficax]|uniref:Glycosyltransferase RgtA/B/C/D-like domain-containing protein n=1 Tax=Pseudofrankia inefficax (strain DSM 45817 / CECT 9037 / DDB 130130 / EuI1c) TaxID=298654 RepID=E3J1X8_PSEI1|nr:hypothetical protein [Pseudofrankia inefficax]ADP84083.1 hypothetical protein FraEuI1c_6099 [Pseudofrankia inefficax]
MATGLSGNEHGLTQRETGGGGGAAVVRRWVALGVVGAGLVFAALAGLTALAMPPFTSGDEAQHTSYALDVASGTLPVLGTPVHAVLPGMPGIPADCRVTPEQARAGIEIARLGVNSRSHGTGRAGPAAVPGAVPGATRDRGRTVKTVSSTVRATPDLLNPGRATPGPGGGSGSQGARTSAVPASTASRPTSLAVQMSVDGGMPACARGSRGIRGNTQMTYTANHPPLFYAIEAVPLKIGLEAGHPIAGFRAARLVNIGFGILALVAVAWLVRELLPGRPDLAVGAAAITGVIGMFVNTAGQVYNDALAVLTITLALAAVVVVLRRGPSTGRLVVLGAAVLAAASTRASGLLAAGLIVPTAGIAVALHAGLSRAVPPRDVPSPPPPRADGTVVDEQETGRSSERRGRLPVWRQVGRGAATTVAGVAVLVAGIGWFYRRNQSLYGDITGSGLIARMFPTSSSPMSIPQILRSEAFWSAIYRGSFGRVALIGEGPVLRPVPTLLLWVFAAGLLLAVARWVARWSLPGLDSGWRSRTLAVVAWLLIALHVVVVTATLVGYVAAGGMWFARYLLPAIPIAALLLATALAALPFARRGLPTVLVVAGLGAFAAVMFTRELAFKYPVLARYHPARRLAAALVMSGVHSPAAVLWLLALCAGLGLGCLACSLWTLAGSAVPRWPLPRWPGGGPLARWLPRRWPFPRRPPATPRLS